MYRICVGGKTMEWIGVLSLLALYRFLDQSGDVEKDGPVVG